MHGDSHPYALLAAVEVRDTTIINRDYDERLGPIDLASFSETTGSIKPEIYKKFIPEFPIPYEYRVQYSVCSFN